MTFTKTDEKRALDALFAGAFDRAEGRIAQMDRAVKNAGRLAAHLRELELLQAPQPTWSLRNFLSDALVVPARNRFMPKRG